MASRSHTARRSAVLLAAALVAVLAARPAKAQLQFTSADGKQSFKIGLLGQLQAESIGGVTGGLDLGGLGGLLG